MIDQYLQCCYTNATHETGGVVSSGWETVAVSPGIAQKAYQQCEKLQKINSTIFGEMLDEDGETLNLFEIAGDGSHLIVMRSQYGFRDLLGRANMFSHAFLLPCRIGEIIHDPNEFLTIANENFKVSEQEALAPYPDMVRLAPWTLESAMERCGLTMETYLTLVQAVYTQATDKKMLKPLYIQYDGTDEELRGLLFCIYSALPLFLRRTLSVASCATDNTENKNIIFSKSATKQSYYIVPNTGETSVLSERLVRRIARLGFVNHVFNGVAPSGWFAYFAELEQKAIALGNANASSEVMLKIAYLLLTSQELGDLEDDGVMVRVGDTLRAGIWGNEAMECYMLTLLNEVVARKLELSLEEEDSLVAWMSEAVYAPFKACAEEYIFDRFRNLTPSDAAQRLSHMGAELFGEYREKLKQSDVGLAILDAYYKEVALPVAEQTWQELERILQEIADLGERIAILRAVYRKAQELYHALVLESKDNGFAQVPQAYQDFANIIDQCVPIQYGEAKKEEIKNTAKTYFWDQVDLQYFDFEIQVPYRSLQMETPLSQAVNVFCDLPDGALLRGDHAGFFLETWECFAMLRQCRSQEEVNLAYEGLLIFVKQQHDDLGSYFDTWYELTMKMEEKEALYLLRDVYDAITKKAEAELIELYIALSQAHLNRGLLQEIATALIDICLDWDCADKPILLDTWLCLGKGKHPNCFELFDEKDVELLSMEASEVVERSKCLEEAYYRDAATRYIEDRGQESRTVKKWLAEYKRLEKRKSSGGGSGGLFGLQVPKFGKRDGKKGKREE